MEKSVTFTGACANEIKPNGLLARLLTKRKTEVILEFHSTYYKCHLLSDGDQPITNVIYYLMALELLYISFTI